MTTEQLHELRNDVGAAYLQLRAARNTLRDTLSAVARMKDALEPVLDELGLDHLREAQPKEAQPNEQDSRSPAHARCVV